MGDLSSEKSESSATRQHSSSEAEKQRRRESKTKTIPTQVQAHLVMAQSHESSGCSEQGPMRRGFRGLSNTIDDSIAIAEKWSPNKNAELGIGGIAGRRPVQSFCVVPVALDSHLPYVPFVS
jgi:hypothetical protein